MGFVTQMKDEIVVVVCGIVLVVWEASSLRSHDCSLRSQTEVDTRTGRGRTDTKAGGTYGHKNRLTILHTSRGGGDRHFGLLYCTYQISNSYKVDILSWNRLIASSLKKNR